MDSSQLPSAFTEHHVSSQKGSLSVPSHVFQYPLWHLPHHTVFQDKWDKFKELWHMWIILLWLKKYHNKLTLYITIHFRPLQKWFLFKGNGTSTSFYQKIPIYAHSRGSFIKLTFFVNDKQTSYSERQSITRILQENLTAIKLYVFLDNSPYPQRQRLKCSNERVPYQNKLQLKPLLNNKLQHLKVAVIEVNNDKNFIWAGKSLCITSLFK